MGCGASYQPLEGNVDYVAKVNSYFAKNDINEYIDNQELAKKAFSILYFYPQFYSGEIYEYFYAIRYMVTSSNTYSLWRFAETNYRNSVSILFNVFKKKKQWKHIINFYENHEEIKYRGDDVLTVTGSYINLGMYTQAETLLENLVRKGVTYAHYQLAYLYYIKKLYVRSWQKIELAKSLGILTDVLEHQINNDNDAKIEIERYKRTKELEDRVRKLEKRIESIYGIDEDVDIQEH